MILDMIGHQLVDTELVHAELTKAESVLVKVLFFFSKHFHASVALCPQPHCSEEKATLKIKSVGKIPVRHFSSQTIALEK